MTKRAVIVAIALIVAALHFVTGKQYQGPFPVFVNGYLTTPGAPAPDRTASTCERSTWRWSIKSSKRPGVATSTSTPRRIA